MKNRWIAVFRKNLGENDEFVLSVKIGIMKRTF
jgi:hypothetical protein